MFRKRKKIKVNVDDLLLTIHHEQFSFSLTSLNIIMTYGNKNQPRTKMFSNEQTREKKQQKIRI